MSGSNIFGDIMACLLFIGFLAVVWYVGRCAVWYVERWRKP